MQDHRTGRSFPLALIALVIGMAGLAAYSIFGGGDDGPDVTVPATGPRPSDLRTPTGTPPTGGGGSDPTAIPSDDPPVPDAKVWCKPSTSGPSPAPLPDILGAVLLVDSAPTPQWHGQNGITVKLIPQSGPTVVTVTGPCPWNSAIPGVFTFDVADGTHSIEITQSGSIANAAPFTDPDDLTPGSVQTANKADVDVPSPGPCTEAVFSYQ